MTLRLYNTLTRRLEDFEPRQPPTVTMYVCGPTVYDDPHIGHARSAYVFDVLRRYLASRHFEVTFVRNVTDVDDKIIAKARDTGLPVEEVTRKYLASYHDALRKLGIDAPTREPKATEHVVPDMTDLIAKLLVNGVAYEAGGDVYFAVRKFEGYGRLSNRTVDELKSGARIEPGEHPGPPGEPPAGAGKQDPLDFALWKAAKPGEPSWKSPWGEGRPGWHMECSTMSMKYLGEAFDIHGGGVDLVFPHHENEIAQAQAAGKPFAKYWVHNGLLTVNGEKMSKSLGNFITVDQALKACFGKSDALKVFFLNAHYRNPTDYTEESVLAANRRLNGLIAFLDRAATYKEKVDLSVPSKVQELETEFTKAMDDDLKTPEALAVLDKLASWGYQQEKELLLSMKPLESGQPPTLRRPTEVLSLKNNVTHAAATILKLGRTLGLLERYELIAIPSDIRLLVATRQVARSEKNFQRADMLRKEIEAKGFLVDDTSGEPVIRPKQKR